MVHGGFLDAGGEGRKESEPPPRPAKGGPRYDDDNTNLAELQLSASGPFFGRTAFQGRRKTPEKKDGLERPSYALKSGSSMAKATATTAQKIEPAMTPSQSRDRAC